MGFNNDIKIVLLLDMLSTIVLPYKDFIIQTCNASLLVTINLRNTFISPGMNGMKTVAQCC